LLRDRLGSRRLNGNSVGAGSSLDWVKTRSDHLAELPKWRHAQMEVAKGDLVRTLGATNGAESRRVPPHQVTKTGGEERCLLRDSTCSEGGKCGGRQQLERFDVELPR